MNHSNLYDFITFLEYGTKLHIGVLFFGHYGDERLCLPHSHTIHTGEICNEIKMSPLGYKKCFKCRNMAIKKAFQTKKPFGGFCINGIYEYIHPVLENDDIICIIFIGNIFLKNKRFNLQYKELTNSMESDFSSEQCKKLSFVIESYVRMILSNPLAGKTNENINPLIRNIKKFAEANMEFDNNISYIADIFHYNEKYLGRLFKKETGIGYSEYINILRLNQAKTLLTETSDTITKISETVGYSDVSYFNHMFKKHFSITPSQYRKKQRRFY